MKRIVRKLQKLRVKEERDIERLYDEDGNDVTPMPLTDPFRKKMQPSVQSGVSTIRSSVAKSPSFAGSERSSFGRPADSPLIGATRVGGGLLRAARTAKLETGIIAEQEEQVLPGEPQVFRLVLHETETMWLLELPSTVLPQDSPQAEQLSKDIDRYKELTEGKGRHRKMVHEETQTPYLPTKRKATQTTPIVTKSVPTFVSAWDIYDTYQEQERGDVNEGSDEILEDPPSPTRFAITDVDSFLHSGMILERLLASNTYRHQQALFTGFPPTPDADAGGSRFQYILHPLWVLQSAATKGRAVISLAWNTKNKEILAVGYGQWAVQTDQSRSGLVCCWSVKNPVNPERSYAQPRPVTCVTFSRSKPNLLAVGDLEGTLTLIDVSSPSRRPRVLTCNQVPREYRSGREHLGPIWGLRFTSDWGSEVLLSTAEDGYLQRWQLDQNGTLHCMDVMEMLRPARMPCIDAPVDSTHAASDSPVFKLFTGLALEVCLTANPATLFVATSEGYLVQVEAELQVRNCYKGHLGPIFCLQASPFCPDLVMTGSADGNISMWTTDQQKPLLTLKVSEYCAVVGAAWSPSHSTMLAAACEKEISLWDLSRHTHAPVSKINLPELASTLCFCPAGRNVIVGDREGSVHVYNLQEMPYPPYMQLEALVKVIPELKTHVNLDHSNT